MPVTIRLFLVAFVALAVLLPAFQGQAGAYFSEKDVTKDCFAAFNCPGEQLAAAGGGDFEDVNDPLEPLNRFFFGFNEAFQVMLLRPMSEFYEGLIPPLLRTGIGNVLDNLGTPVVLANDLLQGEEERALKTIQRFIINTTYGIGGIIDQAEKMGIPAHNEDFGQTLGVWGFGEGIYLVLPLYGPSNLRDAIGRLTIDQCFDLASAYLYGVSQGEASLSMTALSMLDEYSNVMGELNQVKKASIDYYATVRSMYRQKRAAEIRNGKEMDLPPLPDLGYGYGFDGDIMGVIVAP